MTDKPLEEMSKEELEAYEKALNKELKIKDLKDKSKQLAEAKQKEENDAKELAEQTLKDNWEKEFYEQHPEYRPQPKIKQGGEQPQTPNKNETYINIYYEKHKTVRTPSKYERELKKDNDVLFQCYKAQHWTEVGFDELFANTDSDTGCEDDVSDWSPDDVYAKIVWNTFVCKADLFKLAVKGLAINPGDGLGVQIRAYGAFGDPSELASCECASCASISFSTYPLTLKQYNLEAIICDKDIWDVGGLLMSSYLDAMSDSWARWFDAQIYSELETATPGTTETLPNALSCTPAVNGSCCTDTSLLELYNAVHALVASMREGTGLAGPYDPDWLIISPTVAAIFKRMQTPTPMPWMADVKFDESGRLTRLAGLNVVEFCGANTCTDASGQEVAIVIDSRRAVGAVFGQRPKTYKFFQSNCNSYRIDQWAYFAVGELDTDAIGHVVNP